MRHPSAPTTRTPNTECLTPWPGAAAFVDLWFSGLAEVCHRVQMPDADNDGRPLRDWRATLTAYLLGGASGMATNLISGATAYRAIVAAVIVAAMLASSTRLRMLPPRAPIVRYSIWLMLTLSLAAALATAIGPLYLTPYMIFGAVVLTGAAALIPAAVTDRFAMLGAAASSGIGVALICAAIALFAKGDNLFGVGAFVGGVAAVGGGIVVLASSDVFVAMTSTGGKVTMFCGGMASIGGGIIMLLNRDVLVGVAAVCGGSAMIGGAAAIIAGRQSLMGMAAIAGGVASIGGGVAAIADRDALLADRDILIGLAMIGLGIASLGFGLVYLRSIGHTEPARHWLMSLTKDPGSGKTDPD